MSFSIPASRGPRSIAKGRSTTRIKRIAAFWSLLLRVSCFTSPPLFRTLGTCEGFRVLHYLPPSYYYQIKFHSQQTWGSVGHDESLQPSEEVRNNDKQQAMSAQTSPALTDADWLAITNKKPANKKPARQPPRNKMELMWCSRGGTADACIDAIRERTVGDHNQILLNGPATGQVAYYWNKEPPPKLLVPADSSQLANQTSAPTALQCVLFLIKQGGSDNNQLLRIAAEAAHNLTSAHSNLHILLDPGTAARLKAQALSRC